MKKIIKLQTKRLCIREVAMTDLDNIHQHHLLPETDKYNTLGIPESIKTTEGILSNWVESNNHLPRLYYVFCIEDKSKRFIGLVGINMGNYEFKNAIIWYSIEPKEWNKGYATEAAKRIVQFCFKKLKLHRVEAGCAVENIASSKVLEKVGMTQEGMKRKNLPLRGEWFDGFIYAILDKD